MSDPELLKTVDQIIADVRQHGNAHVLKLTQQFDRHPAHQFSDLELTQEQLKTAFEGLSTEVREALELAANRIREFHQAQKQEGWTYVDALGNTLGQKVTPLDRVGIYVPGGLASYPSSVLMNAVPAHVAGVPEIIMVVPAPNGELNPLVLAAAYLAGVSRVFTIGGAQAVAALAYGTETIPAVDKITGPGNRFVAAAKRAVFGQVGIDMIAGPSEILVYAEGVNNAQWLAMDLLSQAEHDTVAQAVFITPDEQLLNEVELAIEAHLQALPKAEIARTSIANPLVGLGDYIVDVVDTGNTLRANGLEPLEEICKVSSRLIVNKASFKRKQALLNPILAQLETAVAEREALKNK
ncbi:MAG: histidinol dehydrogenase [Acinetobacter sp.]|nr:histidinol dehydrogenase [Acinetobacter sp.]